MKKHMFVLLLLMSFTISALEDYVVVIKYKDKSWGYRAGAYKKEQTRIYDIKSWATGGRVDKYEFEDDLFYFKVETYNHLLPHYLLTVKSKTPEISNAVDLPTTRPLDFQTVIQPGGEVSLQDDDQETRVSLVRREDLPSSPGLYLWKMPGSLFGDKASGDEESCNSE